MSSTNVSPTTVFWRRIARASVEIGANSGLELDLGRGDVLAVDAVLRRRQLDRLHLADRDAADPHVGLGREPGRLGEVGREPVALRLEAAIGPPNVIQRKSMQAEAREREAGGDEDPGD